MANANGVPVPVLLLPNVATPGTYTKVTIDAKGRVTTGATLASGDIPNNAANTSGTAANITGVLPLANLTDGATAGIPLLAGGAGGDPSYTALDLTRSAAVSGALPVNRGGSGAATLAAHALLVGNGTTALLTLAPGTVRNVAISDGTDWGSRALVAADIPTLTLAKISDAGTIASQGANAVAITGGTIDGVNVGPTTPGTVNATTVYVGATGGPVATELTVITTSASDPRGIMSAQYSTDGLASRIHLRKARGTPAAPTVIVAGDILGRMRFSGYDGTNFLQMASIDAVSTGTIASTRIPTYLSFSVATDAAPSVLTEVARLTSTGLNNVVLGATTPAAITGTVITANTRLVSPVLAPSADSTTALKVTKADGSTVVMTVDTTNGRLGIGATPGAAIHVQSGSDFIQLDPVNRRIRFFFSGAVDANISTSPLGLVSNTEFKSPGSIYSTGAGIGSGNPAANLVQGTLQLFSALGTSTYIGFGEQGGAFRGSLGYAAASGTLTYKQGNQLFTGTTLFSITSAGVLTEVAVDAATAAVTNVVIFDHTGGTSAPGFGTGALWKGNSSSQSREMVDLQAIYNSPTDANYTTYGLLRAYYMSAGTPTARNAIGWGATGSASLLGFHNIAGAPIAQAVLATGASHTVDDVITALQNLGLVKQS